MGIVSSIVSFVPFNTPKALENINLPFQTVTHECSAQRNLIKILGKNFATIK